MARIIPIGSTQSHDGKRIASIFMDRSSKGQKYSVETSDDGKVRIHYEWTIFDACETAQNFVSGKLTK